MISPTIVFSFAALMTGVVPQDVSPASPNTASQCAPSLNPSDPLETELRSSAVSAQLTEASR